MGQKGTEVAAIAGGADAVGPSGRVPLIALTGKLTVGGDNAQETAGAVVDDALLRRANLAQRDVAVEPCRSTSHYDDGRYGLIQHAACMMARKCPRPRTKLWPLMRLTSRRSGWGETSSEVMWCGEKFVVLRTSVKKFL